MGGWRRGRWAVIAVTAGLATVLALLVVQLGDDGERSAPAPGFEVTTSTTRSTTSSASTSTTERVTSTAPPSTTTTAWPGEPAMAVRRGDPARRAVALTFDAGSDTGNAAQVLDLLAANRIHATFGMTGRWAEANPALVARMRADGHQLVNHSYDHPSFTGVSTGEPPLSRAQRLDQLARAEAAIAAAGGGTVRPWFRPPYGDEDASVRGDVGSAGYRYELLWTVDSLGWKGIAPDAVVERCLDGAVPGAIFLFHVGAASTDHLALQRIIDGLEARGYDFVTAAGLVTG